MLFPLFPVSVKDGLENRFFGEFFLFWQNVRTFFPLQSFKPISTHTNLSNDIFILKLKMTLNANNQFPSGFRT